MYQNCSMYKTSIYKMNYSDNAFINKLLYSKFINVRFNAEFFVNRYPDVKRNSCEIFLFNLHVNYENPLNIKDCDYTRPFICEYNRLFKRPLVNKTLIENKIDFLSI